MSTTTMTSTPDTTLDADTPHAVRDRNTTRRPRVWTVGLTAGVAAAIATSLTAVLATAAGQGMEVGGETIPVSGFATLTLIGAVLGIVIAKIAQRTGHARRVFVTATVTLTALSIIPDFIADAAWATRLVLATTHVIAAAIIIPTVAHRLDA